MSKDIHNIDTYETITKVNTTKWKPIYEVINKSYTKDSKIYSEDFIKECMDISKKSHDKPREVKNNIKRMEIEQGLYAQGIMISQKYLKVVATDKKKMKLNLSFKVNLQDHNDGLILT